MTESVDRQTAVLRLRGADDILILCHKNPDGDTIGCAGALYLALKALGKNAAILCSDPIPKMYDYMELRWFDGSFNPAFVVAVDVASIQLLAKITMYRSMPPIPTFALTTMPATAAMPMKPCWIPAPPRPASFCWM